MIDDHHLSIKRWERAKQIASIESDPDLTAPLAWCKVPNSNIQDEEKIRVYIIRLFQKGFVCVKSYRETGLESLPGPYWLTRGAIDWEEYLRSIVNHYLAGRSVPDSFRPLRKISAEIINGLAKVPNSNLPSLFSKLRETGILRQLPILDKINLPASLPWDNLRSYFLDFEKDKRLD